MAIRMAKLTRTPTGLWTARKVIPADVRGAYGKREEKPTWPASLTQGQARAEFGVWLAGVEDRIAFLRSSRDGPSVDLSERQLAALAGKWYRQLEERFGDNPGDEEGWDMTLESLCPEETDESYKAYVRGDDRPFDGPWRVTPFLEAELRGLLHEEQLKITVRATERLQQEMAGLYAAFCGLMTRRANGDYGADTLVARLPIWEPPALKAAQPVASVVGPTITSLFEGYVAEPSEISDYGDIVELRRVWMRPAFSSKGRLATAITALLDQQFSERSMLILKAFPLEYECKVTDKNEELFRRRQRAMMRHYSRVFGVNPLPGSAGDDGWMYEIPVGLSTFIPSPSDDISEID